jgi:hypothetical protein
MAYLSLCCVVKDEDLFIGEWLTYHALLGVEHFYIYDNESARPVQEHPAVARYIKNGRATVHAMPGRAVQYTAYRHCIKNYGACNFWMGFLDLDEFICLNTREGWMDFRPLLAEFEHCGGLALNWRTMTSSGHERRPEGLVIANYCRAMPELNTVDLHVKSIVRPQLAVKITNPHSFELAEGNFMVNEKGWPLPPRYPFSPISRKRAWINHYYFKSREDFKHKLSRGRADTGEMRGSASLLDFERQKNILTVEENSAAKLAPLVEKYAESVPPSMPEPQSEQGLEAYFELVRAILDDRPHALWAEFYADYSPAQAEKFNRAEAVLCKAAEHYSREPGFWVMRAYLARHQRKFELAEQFLNQALTIEEHPLIHEERFHLAMARGDKKEVESVFFYLSNLPYKEKLDSALVNRISLYGKMLEKW